MAKSQRHRPGGGSKSRVNVSPNVRTGAGATRIRHAGVAQIGQAQGSHVTEQGSTSYRGINARGGPGFDPVKYGNEVALNVGKGGPGAGRNVMRSGSQGMQGAAAPGNPMPKANALWPGWESKR